MNVKDRDELMIRLDERSRNTWKSIEKIELHMSEQNGYIRDNFRSTQRNTVWRKVIVSVGGAIWGILAWLITGEVG